MQANVGIAACNGGLFGVALSTTVDLGMRGQVATSWYSVLSSRQTCSDRLNWHGFNQSVSCIARTQLGASGVVCEWEEGGEWWTGMAATNSYTS